MKGGRKKQIKERRKKGTKEERKGRSEREGSVLSDIPKRGIKLDTWLQNKGLENEKFFYKPQHSQIWGGCSTDCYKL